MNNYAFCPQITYTVLRNVQSGKIRFKYSYIQYFPLQTAMNLKSDDNNIAKATEVSRTADIS